VNGVQGGVEAGAVEEPVRVGKRPDRSDVAPAGGDVVGKGGREAAGKPGRGTADAPAQNPMEGEQCDAGGEDRHTSGRQRSMITGCCDPDHEQAGEREHARDHRADHGQRGQPPVCSLAAKLLVPVGGRGSLAAREGRAHRDPAHRRAQQGAHPRGHVAEPEQVANDQRVGGERSSLGDDGQRQPARMRVGHLRERCEQRSRAERNADDKGGRADHEDEPEQTPRDPLRHGFDPPS
jgi:hypothetical protein